MLKKILIILSGITLCLASCTQEFEYGRTYLSTDHIVIAPRLEDNVTYIQYTLDDRFTHKSTEMPFILELAADTLSLGDHKVTVQQYYSPSPNNSTIKISTISFTIINL